MDPIQIPSASRYDVTEMILKDHGLEVHRIPDLDLIRLPPDFFIRNPFTRWEKDPLLWEGDDS